MEPQQTNNAKLIYSIGGIVLLLLGTVGGYYLGHSRGKTESTVTPTQTTSTVTPTTVSTAPTATDETATWKTYTNTKYGYSFKYPESNQAPENEGIDGTPATNVSQVLHIYLTEGTAQTNDLTAIRFSAYPLSTSDKKLSLADLVKSISHEAYTTSEVKVGNETAIKVNYTTGGYNILNNAGQVVIGSSGSDVRFIKHNDTIYLIEPNENGTKTGNPTLADQILSTFKFTK
jgi:hypothetical protein